MSIDIKLPDSILSLLGGAQAQPEPQPEVPDNLLVPRERIDQMSDPSTGNELPRQVGAELEDPDSGSTLTRLEKTKLMQARTLLMNRRV